MQKFYCRTVAIERTSKTDKLIVEKILGRPVGRRRIPAKKTWEGMVEKVSARLSKCTWVLPQLSYRGRVLVTNNLITIMLWHKFTALKPPETLVIEKDPEEDSGLFLEWTTLDRSPCLIPASTGGMSGPD